MIRPVSYMPAKVERIEVRRSSEEATEVRAMLISHGFEVTLEEYICGFWLVHWSFPRLTVVK